MGAPSEPARQTQATEGYTGGEPGSQRQGGRRKPLKDPLRNTNKYASRQCHKGRRSTRAQGRLHDLSRPTRRHRRRGEGTQRSTPSRQMVDRLPRAQGRVTGPSRPRRHRQCHKGRRRPCPPHGRAAAHRGCRAHAVGGCGVDGATLTDSANFYRSASPARRTSARAICRHEPVGERKDDLMIHYESSRQWC